MGYYNREDLPFYYQLADAFTIFDQYFCSSLTGLLPIAFFIGREPSENRKTEK
ncbi:alkaline phosphatase family protein [Chryseobacterium wanjuense]